MNPTLITCIFVLTYLGIAFGRFPALKIDRPSIALIGTILMLACGGLDLPQLIKGIDFSTLFLLFSLMLISAQLELSNFYLAMAHRITLKIRHPALFLFQFMLISALLSALLTNDIICLCLAPILIPALQIKGLNPLPFLLSLAMSSNIGSAMTIIGNPQNILIGQSGKLDFLSFFIYCFPPCLLSLGLAYLLLYLAFRNQFYLESRHSVPRTGVLYDKAGVFKGLFLLSLLIFLFFCPIDRTIAALTVSSLVLISRRIEPYRVLQKIDWGLLILFFGLFGVIKAIENIHLPQTIMTALPAINITESHTLTLFSAILSNLVSNVPAVMLLIKFLPSADPEPWYILAIASTFAGNFILLGSIANLIVAEQAKKAGVSYSFKEHARFGIPITLLSLLVLLGWIHLRGLLC